MTISSLKTGKLDDVITDYSQLLAICPMNNMRVTTNQWQQTTVIGDEALWWKCPECEDWHLIVIDRQKEQEKKH